MTMQEVVDLVQSVGDDLTDEQVKEILGFVYSQEFPEQVVCMQHMRLSQHPKMVLKILRLERESGRWKRLMSNLANALTAEEPSDEQKIIHGLVYGATIPPRSAGRLVREKR